MCAWSTGSALARHHSAAGGETPAARLRLTTEILHHVPQKNEPILYKLCTKSAVLKTEKIGKKQKAGMAPAVSGVESGVVLGKTNTKETP